MCRNKTEGARRCACDTSEARRLRRRNASKVAGYTAQAKINKDIAPETTVTTTEVTDNIPTVETIKEKTVEVKQLQELILSDPHLVKDATVELSDGSTLKVENRLGVVYDAEGNVIDGPEIVTILAAKLAEKRTIEIGNDVSTMVIDRMGGVTPEDMAEKEAEDIKKFDAQVSVLQANLKEALDARVIAFPDQRDEEKGYVTKTSNTVFQEAVRDQDEKALELVDRYQAAVKELNDLRLSVINSALGKSPEVTEYMNKYREETVSLLKEIRPLGGKVALAERSNKNAVTALETALEVYPSEWIEDTNNLPKMVVKSSSKRAHYTAGSYQKEYKVMPDYSLVTKPEGWEPDPTTYEGVGVWHKADKYGIWKDEENGTSYEFSGVGPGRQVWVRQEVEWYRPIYTPADYDHEQKPRGNGWQKIYEPETKWDAESRSMKETGRILPRWYRSKKVRRQVSMALKPELTVPTVFPRGASPETKEAVLKEARSTAIHEFGHRVENSPRVGAYITKLENAFINRRTTDATTGQQERKVRVGPGRGEVGYEDNFITPYMGKIYETDRQGVAYREVLTTGAEAVFGTRYGSFAGLGRQKKDPEMRNFILGLWASA